VRYGERYLSQEEPKLRRFTYQEGKQCMLILTKLPPDFSAGCALPAIARRFLVIGRIEEETKNGKGRPIELSDKALEALRGHRRQHAGGKG
jgi:hypothetical protein